MTSRSINSTLNFVETGGAHDDLETPRSTAWLYFNGAYPLRLGRFDFRQVIASLETESMVDRLKRLVLESNTQHGLKVEEVQSRAKDGGAFVKFSYEVEHPELQTKEQAEDGVRRNVQNITQVKGYRPWWLIGSSEVFNVKGSPWLEDMDRFANTSIRIEFEGSDIPQEQLWQLIRPFGRVREIHPPTSKDSPRFANVLFHHIRAATAARNCLHGYTYTSSNGTKTTLRILYNPRVRASVAGDWVTNHPRIVLPIVAFLLASLSYTLFDPIRSFFIIAHMNGVFDYKQYRIISWLQSETLGRLGLQRSSHDTMISTIVEKERKDAAERVDLWISGIPETFICITGPNGSGKTPLIESVLKRQKNTLVIDCEAILKTGQNDTKMVSALAKSVGYFPQFAFMASASNLLDLASVGLIGQKAGFSTSTDSQVKQILDITGRALKRLAERRTKEFNKRLAVREKKKAWAPQHPELTKQATQGELNHVRLAAVSGVGVISELGGGVEDKKFDSGTITGPEKAIIAKTLSTSSDDFGDLDVIGLPVVILKNYYAKGSQGKDVLWDSLAEWAAKLIENGVAHVVFTSENVALYRPLTKALPSRPLNFIALNDASPDSARNYIGKKLSDYGLEKVLTSENEHLITKLGGRLNDLETLVQKARANVTLEQAVDEIISRSVTEIKKNCFGESDESAKQLVWSREQAWFLVKALSEKEEILYEDVLQNQFGGDDSILSALQSTELISILSRENGETVIRCGKPVYKSAINKLLEDSHFRAVNELRIAAKTATQCENDIQSATEQLKTLAQLFQDGRWSMGSTSFGSSVPQEIRVRVESILAKMKSAEEDQVKAKQVQADCKAILKQRM